MLTEPGSRPRRLFQGLTAWDRRVAVLSLLAGLATLLELTEDIAGARHAPEIDRQISNRMLDLRSEFLTDALQVVTRLAATEASVVVAAIAVAGAAYKAGHRLALPVLAAILATTVVVLTMKGLIGRERPLPPISLTNHSSAAYPSGHSAHAVGTWGALVWMVFTGGTNRSKSIGALLAVTLALVIGFSRVYLGAHWASDVVAGWAVGGICLSGAILASSTHRATPTVL